MNHGEIQFLKKYSENRFEYYRDNVFKMLRPQFRDFKDIEMIYAKNEADQKEKKLLIQTNRITCFYP